MVKYACPENIEETAGTTAPEGRRFSIVRMSRLLKVSTSGYYQYVKRKAATVLTPKQQRRADLEVKIIEVHRESRGTYGSPRVTAELRSRGEVVTKKTVARIMASVGIEGISPRTFKTKTTVVDPQASFPPDLIERCFDQGRTDAAWFTDITYLTCGEGDMFLCAIRDGHSRKVLGYSMSDHIGAEMVTTAIDRAVATRGGRCEHAILHSDRGGEYTAHLTAAACVRYGLRRSMGLTGICWDNSPSESFWSVFKHEEYYRHTYATKAELVAGVDSWVGFYNTVRRNSAVGMLSPDSYERSLRVEAA
ncbi:MAG: IS3 family transposase [Rhodococcus sp. (in: high G+C Gram-positive bacteria)]|uniref:IS3 family transposase n=1 Tax=Rhodococcus sp. TaxID=1831 RepID=UPI003BB68CDD